MQWQDVLHDKEAVKNVGHLYTKKNEESEIMILKWHINCTD